MSLDLKPGDSFNKEESIILADRDRSYFKEKEQK
jgi:hypothetical protein